MAARGRFSRAPSAPPHRQRCKGRGTAAGRAAARRTRNAGDAPRPWEKNAAGASTTTGGEDAKGSKMTRVQKYDNVLTARVSDADFRAVCERCDEEEISRSEYLRYVVRMVADDARNAERGGVLLDGRSMRKMSRELVKWGHHYNQGMHALNSIKFALDHGRMDADWISAKLDQCELLLAQVDEGRSEIAAGLASLEERAIVGGD